MKRTKIPLLLVTLFIAPFYTIAHDKDDKICGRELPIDTVKKAWCSASDILLVQSCISKHGFTEGSKDLDDRWLLTSSDNNPDKDKSCKATRIVVCKKDGKTLNKESDECSS